MTTWDTANLPNERNVLEEPPPSDSDIYTRTPDTLSVKSLELGGEGLRGEKPAP